jgi:hypothetical protein
MRVGSDTDTYDYIELCYFFKLLSCRRVSVCKCMCLCPYFICYDKPVRMLKSNDNIYALTITLRNISNFNIVGTVV